jgi:hypothetical protein
VLRYSYFYSSVINYRFIMAVTLPTTFIPDSSCLGNTNIWDIIVSSTAGCIPGQCPDNYYFLQGPPTFTGCLPPSYKPSRSLLYIGPCPQGYEIACTSSASFTNAVTVFSLVFETACSILTIPPAASNAKPPIHLCLWAASLHSQHQQLFL